MSWSIHRTQHDLSSAILKFVERWIGDMESGRFPLKHHRRKRRGRTISPPTSPLSPRSTSRQWSRLWAGSFRPATTPRARPNTRQRQCKRSIGTLFSKLLQIKVRLSQKPKLQLTLSWGFIILFFYLSCDESTIKSIWKAECTIKEWLRVCSIDCHIYHSLFFAKSGKKREDLL